MVSAMKTPAVDIGQVSLLPGRGQVGRHARVRPRYPHLLISRSLPTKRNSLGRIPTPCAPRRVPMNRDPPYRLTRRFGLFAGNIENNAETCFAAHHAVVRLGRFFQRKNFVHGMYVRRRTKFECVLRIDGGT